MEGKGQAAYSEGMTDTYSKHFLESSHTERGKLLTCFISRGVQGREDERLRVVFVRVQRRVRMGKKDKVGLPYIPSPS